MNNLDINASVRIVREAINKQLPPKDALIANAIVDLVLTIHIDLDAIRGQIQRIADSQEWMEPS